MLGQVVLLKHKGLQQVREESVSSVVLLDWGLRGFLATVESEDVVLEREGDSLVSVRRILLVELGLRLFINESRSSAFIDVHFEGVFQLVGKLVRRPDLLQGLLFIS